MKAVTAMYVVCAILMCSILGGCASFGEHENQAKVLVTYGTFKAIEQGDTREEQAARATKIRDIALKARDIATGEDLVLAALEASIRDEVSKLNLEPADQYLAGVLVEMVIAELEARVCNADAPDANRLCAIPEDQRFVVTEVLDWVIDATAIYAGA